MKKAIVLNTISDAVLIVCCALASACAIPSAYGAPYILPMLLLVELPLALILARDLRSSEKPFKVVIITAAVILFCGLLVRRTIVPGAKLVWYSAAELLSFDFSFIPIPQLPEISHDPDIYVTAFLIFSESCISVIAALLLIKCKSRIPSLLIPVPAFIPAMIYITNAPALYIIALLLIYWAGVLFGRTKALGEEKLQGLSRSVFIIMLALLALLIPVFSKEDRFEPIPFSQRRGILEAMGSVRDGILSNRTGSHKEYELISAGDRELDDEKVFSVCSSKEGIISLRTHSYGLYSDGKWQPSEEYSGAWSSMLALGSTQSGTDEVLRVRDAYNGERITPYAFLPRYDVSPGEAYIKANGKTAYSWHYLSDIELTRAESSTTENKYWRFALENYTLPKSAEKQKLLSLLEELTSPEWVASLKEADPYRAAELVAAFVSRSADYSLTPGTTPENRDFVEYFLKQNKKGYCVHFASATTALLQALDIPARFVLGYRVEIAEPEVWQDVPGRCFHAWTEVYIKGVGWLPLESTAGFTEGVGFILYGYSPDGMPAGTEDSGVPFGGHPQGSPESTEKPERTRANASASPAPQKTKRPLNSPGALDNGNSGGKAENAEEISANGNGLRYLWLLAIPGIIGVWQAVGAAVKKRRQRSFEQSDSRAAVLVLLKYLNSLKRYGGATSPNAEALANEAAFSNHDMEETRAALMKLVERNKKELCRGKPLMRLALRRVLFKI